MPSTGARATYAALQATMLVCGLPEAILMDHGTPGGTATAPVASHAAPRSSSNKGLRCSTVASAILRPRARWRRCIMPRPVTCATIDDPRRWPRRNPTLMASARSTTACGRIGLWPWGCRLTITAPAAGAVSPRQRSGPYPADYQAVRLNSEGSMDYHGVRCCVAKTLARQTVGVPEADAKLPVQYRGRYIREIDLTTGKSRAFDRPHHDIPMVSGMS